MAVKINDLNISEVTEKSIFDAKQWFLSLEIKLETLLDAPIQINFYSPNIIPNDTISNSLRHLGL